MRFPVENFKTDWNITAGFSFGAKTSYGYHDGTDINDNGGGNSDFGKSLYAIADGVVASVHLHTTKPTFGKHIHIKIDGAWGTRWVHYAHCNEVFVTEGQAIKEGQRIATVGNSGTDWAHCHFALKKEPTGIDGIATSLDLLKKWEDPIKFIEKWSSDIIIPPMNDQTKIPATLLNSSDYPVSSDQEIQQIRGLLGDFGRYVKTHPDSPVNPPSGPNPSDLSIRDLLILLVEKISKKFFL